MRQRGIVEGDSNLEQSEDEMDEAQREEEDESSEEDTAAVEEPEPGNTHCVLWIRSNV